MDNADVNRGRPSQWHQWSQRDQGEGLGHLLLTILEQQSSSEARRCPIPATCYQETQWQSSLLWDGTARTSPRVVFWHGIRANHVELYLSLSRSVCIRWEQNSSFQCQCSLIVLPGIVINSKMILLRIFQPNLPTGSHYSSKRNGQASRGSRLT